MSQAKSNTSRNQKILFLIKKNPFDKRCHGVDLNFKDLRTTTVISLSITAKLVNRSTAKEKKKESDRFKFPISFDATRKQASSVGSLKKLEKDEDDRRLVIVIRQFPCGSEGKGWVQKRIAEGGRKKKKIRVG